MDKLTAEAEEAFGNIENTTPGGGSGSGNEGGESTEIVMLDGDGQVFFTALPKDLSFRSGADVNTLQEVQVNGVTVDPSNYTITSGSTIITLKEEYLATLGAVDGHRITIVSDASSASANFDVRDTITYEEGDYIYTIMQDGFETLEKARAYYKVWFGNQAGATFDELMTLNGCSS